MKLHKNNEKKWNCFIYCDHLNDVKCSTSMEIKTHEN